MMQSQDGEMEEVIPSEFLVLIKPDGIQRGLKDTLLDEFVTLSGAEEVYEQSIIPTLEQAQEHYIEHKDKDFYERITKGLSSGSICITLWKGPSIEKARNAMKVLREKYFEEGRQRHENLMHVSDSEASAKRELELWFVKSLIY